MTLDAKQLAAYRRAPYRAGGVAFRIGRRNPALDGVLRAMGVREAALLTAANPGGRRRTAAWNDRAMRRLQTRLRRVAWLAGESGAGRWRETQILAAGPLPFLLALARRFGQNAAVRLRLAAPPSLVSLR